MSVFDIDKERKEFLAHIPTIAKELEGAKCAIIAFVDHRNFPCLRVYQGTATNIEMLGLGTLISDVIVTEHRKNRRDQ